MRRVLIADDSMYMRTYLKGILHKNKYEVVAEGHNGEEAIKYYQQYKPDIVLLDITMAKMDGLTALKEILRRDPDANVVMCSSIGSNFAVIEALQIGAKDFIVKPHFDKLINILENISER